MLSGNALILDGTLCLLQVLKVAILAEKFATDYSWYVDTILTLIRIAGDYVSEEVSYYISSIPLHATPRNLSCMQYIMYLVYLSLFCMIRLYSLLGGKPHKTSVTEHTPNKCTPRVANSFSHSSLCLWLSGVVPSHPDRDQQR